MMVELIVWLLLIELVGLAAFPLAFRVFARLPDHGWTMTKPLGLLLLTYGAWLIGLSHTIPNSRWSVLLAFAALALLSWAATRRCWPEVLELVRREARTVILTETLFVAVFVGWVLVRGFLPAIEHTEQPMNYMFLNSVVTSPHYPPNDPWLAGEPVSYYYFGYLTVGVLTLLSGLATAVTFNLALASTAAMAAVAAFGVVYNLVRISRGSRAAASLAGLGAAFLLVGASNLVGTLEMVRVAGIGDQRLWEWVGVEGLTAPAAAATRWIPADAWWWFHAGRVAPGTISEFPAFSLVLGDLHAHVMSMPLVLLTGALALQLHLASGLFALRSLREQWPMYLALPLVLGGVSATNTPDLPLGLTVVTGAVLLNAARQVEAPFHGLRGRWRTTVWTILASIVFLAAAIALFQNDDGTLEVLGAELVKVRYLLVAEGALLAIACLAVLTAVPLRAVALAAVIVAAALLLFSPFLLTFESSASGVLPLRGLLTRPFHLVLVWGVTGFLALAFLTALGRRLLQPMGPWGNRFLVSAAVGFAPVVLWLQPVWGPLLYAGVLLAFVAHRLGFRWIGVDEAPLSIGSGFTRIAAVSLLLALLVYDGITQGERGADGEFSAAARLLIVVPMAVVVTMGIYGAWSLARRQEAPGGQRDSGNDSVAPPNTAPAAALGMLAVAGALIMGVELFHVVDFFGGDLRRMNTVFKLYYQAWLLMALVGGFSLYYVSRRWDLRHAPGRIGMATWSTVLVLALGAVLYYPLAAPYTRVFYANAGFDLDGQAKLAANAPAEYEAIRWIRETLPRGAVVVEAAVTPCADNPQGCSDWNIEVGRIAGSTGRPTVLGWEQHEIQWRWSPDPLAGRRDDVREIYTTTDVARARELLAKYNAQYVVVGRRERSVYGAEGLPKFSDLGEAVFSVTAAGATTTIYRLAS